MLIAAKELVGRTIVKTWTEPDEEGGDIVALQLDDGKVLVAWRDEEQNGPGALFLHGTTGDEQRLVVGELPAAERLASVLDELADPPATS